MQFWWFSANYQGHQDLYARFQLLQAFYWSNQCNTQQRCRYLCRIRRWRFHGPKKMENVEFNQKYFEFFLRNFPNFFLRYFSDFLKKKLEFKKNWNFKKFVTNYKTWKKTKNKTKRQKREHTVSIALSGNTWTLLVLSSTKIPRKKSEPGCNTDIWRIG